MENNIIDENKIKSILNRLISENNEILFDYSRKDVKKFLELSIKSYQNFPITEFLNVLDKYKCIDSNFVKTNNNQCILRYIKLLKKYNRHLTQADISRCENLELEINNYIAPINNSNLPNGNNSLNSGQIKSNNRSAKLTINKNIIELIKSIKSNECNNLTDIKLEEFKGKILDALPELNKFKIDILMTNSPNNNLKYNNEFDIIKKIYECFIQMYFDKNEYSNTDINLIKAPSIIEDILERLNSRFYDLPLWFEKVYHNETIIICHNEKLKESATKPEDLLKRQESNDDNKQKLDNFWNNNLAANLDRLIPKTKDFRTDKIIIELVKLALVYINCNCFDEIFDFIYSYLKTVESNNFDYLDNIILRSNLGIFCPLLNQNNLKIPKITKVRLAKLINPILSYRQIKESPLISESVYFILTELKPIVDDEPCQYKNLKLIINDLVCI